jgi:thiamine transport system permease protein
MGGDRHSVTPPPSSIRDFSRVGDVDPREKSRMDARGVTRWVPWAVAAAVPLAFVAVFFAWPVASIVGRGLFPEGALDVGGIVEVLSRPRTQRIIGFTVGMAAAATAITLVLGMPVAYVLSRLRFRGRGVLRAAVLVPFVLPTVVVGIAFRALLRDTPLDGSVLAILAALVFFNVAVVARTVAVSWESLDPRQEDAARVLGAGPVRVFATITLRRLAPSVAAAASIVFLFCSTAFGTVLVLGGAKYATIETEIWLLTTQFLDLRGAAVLSVAQLVVVLVLLVVTARLRGRTTAQHRSFATRRPRRSDTPVIAAAVLTALALAVPLAALVERSLRVAGEVSLGNYVALASTGARNALAVTPWQALGNSLGSAAAATGLAMLVGLIACILLSRTPRSPHVRRGLDVLDGALMLPLGVSAVTVGFGFLITLNAPPLDLRTSPVLVPIAQALVAVPLVVRTLLPVLRSVGTRMREAAATLGAAPWRVILTIDLGVAGRATLAATGLAFTVALGEFGATTFLSRPDAATLPVVIYRLIGLPGGDNAGMATAASVVLAVVCVAVVALVERLRVDTAGAF